MYITVHANFDSASINAMPFSPTSAPYKCCHYRLYPEHAAASSLRAIVMAKTSSKAGTLEVEGLSAAKLLIHISIIIMPAIGSRMGLISSGIP